MTGVPSHLLMPTDFITLRMGLVDEVGFDAAVILERIRWRCEVRENGWVATYVDLAAETRMSRNRVIAATQVLIERGWLASVNAGQGNRTLRWSVPLSPIVPDQDDGGGIVPIQADHSPESGRSLYREDVREQELLLAESAPVLVAVPDGIEAEFTGFWAVYPRKVGKPAALRAYRSARKRAVMQDIADGLRAQLPDLTRRESPLVPHAATWLNQDRWADDPAHAAQAAPGSQNFYLDLIGGTQ